MKNTLSSRVPTFVPGRKGRTSVVDSLVRALWNANHGKPQEWPERTFTELQREVSKLQGYHVAEPTIRSSIYSRPKIFERVDGDDKIRWRLTKQVRKA